MSHLKRLIQIRTKVEPRYDVLLGRRFLLVRYVVNIKSDVDRSEEVAKPDSFILVW